MGPEIRLMATLLIRLLTKDWPNLCIGPSLSKCQQDDLVSYSFHCSVHLTNTYQMPSTYTRYCFVSW